MPDPAVDPAPFRGGGSKRSVQHSPPAGSGSVPRVTALVELRILEGPNLYFPRAAVKLTVDIGALASVYLGLFPGPLLDLMTAASTFLS